MARGRFITSAICADKKIADLSDDTSRLAFTWLITFADCEGRTYGDPAIVRSMLFPRREDVSIAQMERYIGEWVQVGLVVWYEADGDRWLFFPGFEQNQSGLNKSREAPSRIPAPTESLVNSGVGQEQVMSKSGQFKLSEGESESKGIKEGTPANKTAGDPPPPPPPKPSPRRGRIADKPVPQPSEAVKAYRELAHLWPNEPQKQAIDAAVHPETVPRWTECIEAWLLRGYAKTNVGGMLDWFRDGIPKWNGGKGGNRRMSNVEMSLQNARELLAEGASDGNA